MKQTIYSLILLASMALSSCGDDDVKYLDIEANFATTQLGFEVDNSSVDVAVSLSRAATTAVEVTLNFTPTGVEYGTDFTTTPASTNGKVTVVIPTGETTAAVKINRTSIVEDVTKKLAFTITSTSEGVILGKTGEMSLAFGAILSDGNQMTLEGKSGESVYANSVYVDFSQNIQKAVDRKSWTLGFYCADKFRVFLNPAMQMAAGATTKTDINSVTVADAETVPRLVANMMAGQMIALTNVDDLAGDMTKTAFAEVSATDADNKVYLVAFEGNNTKPEDYYKVRVLRKGTGYSVQYGKLGGTEIKTVDVPKNAEYNMVAVSFTDDKITTPELPKWDVQWSYSTGLTGTSAYFMQDYVSVNTLGGAQVAEVMIPETEDTYAKKLAYINNFKVSDLTSLTFTTARNKIGSEWRVTANMSGSTEKIGIRFGRFYVIKDYEGNYYKLRFLKMGLAADGGERGRPQMEYALVK